MRDLSRAGRFFVVFVGVEPAFVSSEALSLDANDTFRSCVRRRRSARGRSDFAGPVAEHYLSYRRDLLAELGALVAAAFALGPSDVVCDLGCGTGQLSAPLAPHLQAVVAADPEPDMLDGLRTRHLDGVLPVSGSDVGLPRLAAEFGPLTATCGTDRAARDARTALVRETFGRVELITRTMSHRVDADWIIGHLRSAMSPADEPARLEATIRETLARYDNLVEPRHITMILGIA